jgi:hypothetical protein
MQNAHTYRQDHSLAQSQFIFTVFFIILTELLVNKI